MAPVAPVTYANLRAFPVAAGLFPLPVEPLVVPGVEPVPPLAVVPGEAVVGVLPPVSPPLVTGGVAVLPLVAGATVLPPVVVPGVALLPLVVGGMTVLPPVAGGVAVLPREN